MSRLEAIWLKRARRGVMDAVDEATVVEDKGLEDDANFGRGRQVTIIEKEVFDRIRADLPDAEPSMRRANLMVGGVRLAETRGQVLTVGDVRILIRGETRPCNRMDDQVQGLRDALDAGWGGGVHGSVLGGGRIAVGDPVSIDARPDRPDG